MRVFGFNEGYHDAGVCILDDHEIIYASHSERYSGVKNDKTLHDSQISKSSNCDTIAFYENYFLKNTRRLYSGQGWTRKRTSIPYDVSFTHHESHAAAGYYTSIFDECNVLVIDAIGEWDTISIWYCKNLKMKKIKSFKYPYSLGLLYSAITHRIGLKPNEDEYITMGMSAFGEPKYDMEFLLEKNNHKGVGNIFPEAKFEDLAASVQNLYEKELLKLIKKYCHHENLILMGGCALNCVANSKIKNKNIWIMPNPGDCGSSLGAAALVNKKKLNWKNPYLGYNLLRSNPKKVVDELLKNKVCGVASEKAEFGPRALGNRSLLGDCRYPIKDTVNNIKRRQKFRPFAPAILEEYANDYFDGPMNEYMQFVSKAKHDYDSVTHVDGTARVQVVKKSCSSVIREILELWYDKTGIPMLLNTSLNIKGMPIVNDERDVKIFMEKYNVKVF